jgi:hypothetical protein
MLHGVPISEVRPLPAKLDHPHGSISSQLALFATALMIAATVGATGCGLLPGAGGPSGEHGTPGGQGAASSQLSPSSTSVSFGSMTVGDSTAQSVTLTDKGATDVTISAVSVTGSGFNVSGGSNVKLTPNQSVTVYVTFDPTGPGAATGKLSISSNASNSLVQLGLAGTGVTAAVTHRVALNWKASTSAVIGYFVYRGPAANNLSKLIASVDPSPSYTDTSVVGGNTYVYAVTSVDSTNIESAPSSPVSVTIPNN